MKDIRPKVSAHFRGPNNSEFESREPLLVELAVLCERGHQLMPLRHTKAMPDGTNAPFPLLADREYVPNLRKQAQAVLERLEAEGYEESHFFIVQEARRLIRYLSEIADRYESLPADPVLSANAKKGAQKKIENDKSGKHAAMGAIKAEWVKRKDGGQKFTATQFAKDMAKLHAYIVTAEAIKNAQTEWNKEYHPAS